MAEILVRSVKKALDALDRVIKASVSGEEATLSDIAAELNEKLPTVRNILKTMEQCGYLARNGKRYIPGSKCGDMRRCATREKFLAMVKPILEEAAAKTGESLVLTSLIHGHRELLSRHQGSNEVGVNLGIAEYKTVYSLVTTRVMLAYADQAEVESFRRVNGEPGNEWAEAEGGNLGKTLEGLRNTGFACEKNASFCAYAVALTDSSGALLGAVGAYAPAFRITPEREQNLLDSLASVALLVRKQF